jgi:hypothetical protein
MRQDNARGMFPLKSTVAYVQYGEAALREFVRKQILDDTAVDSAFLHCPVAYALKDKQHLRRVLVLDPISTFYIYDFALRNTQAFQASPPSERQFYGCAFKGKKPLDGFLQYHEFRRRKYVLKRTYRYFAKVDIANCFNSFYHHDVVSFLHDRTEGAEHEHFGQFIREINGGVSINCFPQGIYPAKAIGNSFLSFIESSMALQSSAIIRFLDDVFLFDDKQRTLEKDVIVLQQLIGRFGLALNSEKTHFGSEKDNFEERRLDRIKKSLLKKREETKSYDEERESAPELTRAQVAYLKDLVQQRDINEEDVELALSLLREDEDEAFELVSLALTRYPNLTKDVYKLIETMTPSDALWSIVSRRLRQSFLTEYELFWLTRMAIDHFPMTARVAQALLAAHLHPSATEITKAAVLEVPDNRYGLFDLKYNQLRNAAIGIGGACAVAGLHRSEKAKRNQLYKYAMKSSKYMYALCNIASKLIPDEVEPDQSLTPLVQY